MSPDEPAEKRHSVTRRQHLVPRVLLAGFADENGNVQVTHRDGRTHRESTMNASIVKNFYSYRDDDGHLDDTIEQWLANHAEGPAARAIRNAQLGISPDLDEVPAIARFVAVALLRSPYVRAIMGAFDRSIGPVMLANEQLRRAGYDLTSLTKEQRALAYSEATKVWQAHTDPNETRKSNLRTVQRQVDIYTRRLQTWTWTVLSADHPVLVTADVSAASHPQTGTWKGLLPAGHPIYMPVSPRHLLLGEDQPLGSPDTYLAADLTRVVNQEMARTAHDVIITHPDTPWPANIVFACTRPQPPSPTIRIVSTTEHDTFPVRYPAVSDPQIQKTLDALGATDEVE